MMINIDTKDPLGQSFRMKLKILESEFAVCWLPHNTALPGWLSSSHFLSISRTSSELSIVCESALVPSDIKSEKGWKILKIEGTLDFSLTGILASIANPLALEKISIFAISTFDTDYVMVKQENLDRACEVLGLSGFIIL